MFEAIVLAGSGKPDELTVQEGVSNKAFIKIGEKPLLSYIIAALEKSELIEKIVVVGPEDELNLTLGHCSKCEVVAQTESMLDNVATAMRYVNRSNLCLVVTGDIPLVTAEVIGQFLLSCEPYDHDLYYPVLTRETCVTRYPETERTYVRLREGFLTGGNLALIRPAWFLDNRARLDLFISYRKKPLKLMRIFPLRLVLKYLTKTLAVSDIEKFISRLLNLKARAVFCDCVEIGIDVDKKSDLDLVREVLENINQVG